MMIVAAVATSSLAYLGPAALRPLVPASPSVRMQVTASPPAAKRPVAGGGGYLGRGNQKRDAAVNDETMRWYLSSIGTRRLLEKGEEISLAMGTKELLRWKKVQRELEAGPPADQARVGDGVGLQRGREPTPSSQI